MRDVPAQPARDIRRAEVVDDLIDALRRVRPVELSILPGIEETISFRFPAELADI